ncbi:UNVERIFIED_CONTAM: hypothetical protein HDU68_010256 [Siphonaria sp. JEL0065]|nr:hypothetical protein HDU68_010256 [Siphonaria sp. JEL0065]
MFLLRLARRSLHSDAHAQTAALAAFRARTGLALGSDAKLLAALTHRSFGSNEEAEAVDGADNERARLLGQRLLAFHTTHRLMTQYPLLPASAVESLVEAFVGDRALANVGHVLGVPHVMRWKKSAAADPAPLVVAKVVQALVGALYTEKGPSAVADFLKKHIESRSVDVRAHLNLHKNPKHVLRTILKDANRPLPVSRMLKETGRLSTNPVFIVGVYSGIEKLGEGYGSSIAMAETRACKNALENHFTKEVKDVEVPLDILSQENISFLIPGV